MERAKKIKTADLALQSIVALLCFPHSMRVALKKGDYEDVLSISRKIQLMSPGNVLSSAKVLLQVQKTSASIVVELKNKCIDILLGTEKEKENENEDKDDENNGNNHDNNNNENDDFTEKEIVHHIPSIPELYRHVHLLLEIEGEEKQKQNLKICFYKKLTKFGEEIRKYRKRYFFDSNNAVYEGRKYFREKNQENGYGRKDSRNGINLERENTSFHGNKGSYSSYDLHGNDGKRRGSNMSGTGTGTGTDIRGLNQGQGDGPSPDWLPSDTTREEKMILKSILNNKNSKNKNKDNEKEMGNNIKEKKNKNGDNDESEGQRKLKLFSDFGLSENEINEDEEEEEEDEEEDNDNDHNNNNNNNMDRNRYTEKDKDKETKVKFQEQTISQSHTQSTQKTKKFQLFESVDEEENVRKNNQKKAEKERENKNDKSGGDIYILGENPENYYCDLFCARVRLLYVLRVARTVDAWTPVLAQ